MHQIILPNSCSLLLWVFEKAIKHLAKFLRRLLRCRPTDVAQSTKFPKINVPGCGGGKMHQTVHPNSCSLSSWMLGKGVKDLAKFLSRLLRCRPTDVAHCTPKCKFPPEINVLGENGVKMHLTVYPNRFSLLLWVFGKAIKHLVKFLNRLWRCRPTDVAQSTKVPNSPQNQRFGLEWRQNASNCLSQ